MCFQPPLVVHNVLPYPISVILADSANQAENSMFTIGVGGFVEVYQFDLSRKIRMSISMQVSCLVALALCAPCLCNKKRSRKQTAIGTNPWHNR